MTSQDIYNEALIIRNQLKESYDFDENPIEMDFSPIRPFGNRQNVELIIIGQDPTIQQAERRNTIQHTLNLDKNGSLKKYISNICGLLSVPYHNIYATNLFKYFYTFPPADTMTVLQSHLIPNLELVKKELAAFPEAIIVTLGEPVLQLLTGRSDLLKSYWGYNGKSNISNRNFLSCTSKRNLLGRTFFPLPHIRSVSKSFYTNTMDEYARFIKINK